MNDVAGDPVGLDAVHRFMVEHQAVRGRFVRLGPAWLALREHADHPAPVRRLLGEAVAAVALLASTIKFEGELTLQMQGTGAVRLLVAQCTHDLKLRAVARFDAERVEDGFEALVGNGQLAVTVETEGGARYQGIVPLGGGSLAAALERYFEGSEQLPTAIALAADDAEVAGMLVQRMPQSGGQTGGRSGGQGSSADAPSALAAREAEATATLEATRTALAGLAVGELLGRPVEDLLQRICAGHDLRLQPAQSVEFRCRCSVERVSGMLRALGEAELDGILAEQGAVTVTCEFCQRPWRFEAREVAGLFGGADRPVDGSGALN
ncbi:MAG: Hsp33 family molecular chaperone HslO [Gammaproteobacteria bacterium]